MSKKNCYFAILLLLVSCNKSPFSSCNVRPKHIIDGITYLQFDINNELAVGEIFIVDTDRYERYPNKNDPKIEYNYTIDSTYIRFVKQQISIDKDDTATIVKANIFEAIKKGKSTVNIHKVTTMPNNEDKKNNITDQTADRIVGEYNIIIR